MTKNKSGLPLIVPKLPDDFLRFDIGTQLPFIDNTIRNLGTPLTLTAHVVCPCVVPLRNGGTGHGIPDCPECSGTGFAYPGDPQEVVAGVSNVMVQDEHMQQGTLSTGKISVVFPSDVTVAEGDRIHLYKSIVPVRHSRKYKERVGGIRLPFDVRAVRSLVTNNPRTLEIIPLREGADFTLNTEKNMLSFNNPRVISDNSVVSGVFMVAPYYIVDTLLYAFRGRITKAHSDDGSAQFAKLPQEATATRADLLFGRFQKDVSVKGSADKGVGS